MHAVLTSQIADILHFNYKMINKKVSVPPTHIFLRSFYYVMQLFMLKFKGSTV